MQVGERSPARAPRAPNKNRAAYHRFESADTDARRRRHGTQVFVVEDAVRSRHRENYQNPLDLLRLAAVQVVSAESVVFEWLRDASHPHFKSIQSLLR